MRSIAAGIIPAPNRVAPTYRLSTSPLVDFSRAPYLRNYKNPPELSHARRKLLFGANFRIEGPAFVELPVGGKDHPKVISQILSLALPLGAKFVKGNLRLQFLPIDLYIC